MPNGTLFVHRSIFSLRIGALGSKGEKGGQDAEKTPLLSLFKTEGGSTESTIKTKGGILLNTLNYKENLE